MKPVFADPKTDIIFKKIFGEKAHKSLLIALLNALLELDETHQILDIEYLTPEQLPQHPGLRLSILDVKCTDATGTRYVVEMQVLEVEGFQKRVVYNACKAYSSQLAVGQDYPALNDVIAVTICDFVLWPPSPEGPAVPMLSRWRVTEQHSGAMGLPEVQYVFLELPKYEAGDHPSTTVEKWAWFFREAARQRQVPPALASGPYGTAMEVARVANLTEEEGTEYEREKMALQDARGSLSLAERRGVERGLEKGEQIGLQKGEKIGLQKGEQIGLQKGRLEGLRAAVLDLVEILGLPLDAPRQVWLDGLDPDGLEAARAHIKAQRAWPPLG